MFLPDSLMFCTSTSPSTQKGIFLIFLLTVVSTDKFLPKIECCFIGINDQRTSPGMGTLCFPGLPPKELGCAHVLHHPPQPPGPCSQEPWCCGWQGNVLHPMAHRFVTGCSAATSRHGAGESDNGTHFYSATLNVPQCSVGFRTGARNCH